MKQEVRNVCKFSASMPSSGSINAFNCSCENTEGAKSQYPYVGLNSSVTECPIEIILSGMTYYHHWFKEFVKSKHTCVNFCIYLIVWIVGLSQILLNCVWPFKLRLS